MPFQNSQLSTYIQGQRLHCEDMLGQMVCMPSGSSTPDRATDMQTMDDGYGLSGRIRCTGDYRQDKGISQCGRRMGLSLPEHTATMPRMNRLGEAWTQVAYTPS